MRGAPGLRYLRYHVCKVRVRVFGAFRGENFFIDVLTEKSANPPPYFLKINHLMPSAQVSDQVSDPRTAGGRPPVAHLHAHFPLLNQAVWKVETMREPALRFCGTFRAA
jgi:hypothetical protein